MTDVNTIEKLHIYIFSKYNEQLDTSETIMWNPFFDTLFP